MTKEKVKNVIDRHLAQLDQAGVTVSKRIDQEKEFQACSRDEQQAHARWLLEECLYYLGPGPKKIQRPGKLFRHFAFAQALLWASGLIKTIQELRDENRQDES